MAARAGYARRGGRHSQQAGSEAVEPGEDVGLGPVGSRSGVRWAGAVDGGLLDRHVGVQVGVGAGCVLVTEPERDDGDIDPGSQQVHGRRVPQAVHGDVLGCQRGTGLGGERQVPGKPAFESVAGQVLAGGSGERGGSLACKAFGEVAGQHGHGGRRQWRGAASPAFA